MQHMLQSLATTGVELGLSGAWFRSSTVLFANKASLIAASESALAIVVAELHASCMRWNFMNQNIAGLSDNAA